MTKVGTKWPGYEIVFTGYEISGYEITKNGTKWPGYEMIRNRQIDRNIVKIN